MKTLEVKHDRYPENVIPINAVWCDIGSHKVEGWQLMNLAVDPSVCEDCYEHFN